MGSSVNCNLQFSLPEGTFNIKVTVIDDDGSKFSYPIPNRITVNNNPAINDELNKLLNFDPTSPLMKQLYSGKTQDTLRVSNLIASSLTNFVSSSSVNIFLLK